MSEEKDMQMQTRRISSQKVKFHRYSAVVVGAGAAGMNCAVHLYEFMRDKGVEDPHERIAVVTGGLALGASRMSGSDKQTYYKMGTSADFADSAELFAESLTAGGCCHGDLALAEAIGSLREFHHLVQAGVPFPTDSMGGFIGYKTDNDPFERATSAGPETSRHMSECLERQVRACGIGVYDHMEVAELLAVGSGKDKKVVGVVAVDKKKVGRGDYALNVFLCSNLVLAAGGPGELYAASVYPKGQVGIHGLAFRAGLLGENLTEWQFGLASVKFRWNVSGTYMQAIPRMFSTDADGNGEQRDFLTDYFPTMSKMATAIFLKGYQWPFDPQRIEKNGSSLIDVLVFNETQNGRRVFLDFSQSPIAGDSMEQFSINELEPEARQYLEEAGALQDRPIERLECMNPPAIEIYKEHGIDLYSEPLEIAVCAQHNNGGFAVNKWWESNMAHTFVIGEMAGTHGVRRPGGAALNAGQVGGLRAAEYIVNVYGMDLPQYSGEENEIDGRLAKLISGLNMLGNSTGLAAAHVKADIQRRMSSSAGHIRELGECRRALADAVELYRDIQRGLGLGEKRDIVQAIQAEHLALTSIAYLKAVVELLEMGSGSRGSHLVVADGGIEIHPDVFDGATGKPLRFKPENESVRDSILRIEYDDSEPDLFRCVELKPRAAGNERKAFETAWRDYRQGSIYGD